MNRWIALSITCLAFLQLTINWFDIVPFIPNLMDENGLSLVEIGSLVSAFLAGYGIMHIPAGIIAERLGTRNGLVIGLAIEGLGAAITAAGSDFGILLLSRALAGAGAATIVGSSLGIIAGWFRDKEFALATGIVFSVAFTVGAAIGIYFWEFIGEAIGWRQALWVGVVISAALIVVTMLVDPSPPTEEPAPATTMGSGHGLASLGRVFSNGRLWLMGLAFFGGYGSYFATANLLPGYVVDTLNVTEGQAHLVSAIYMLVAIPAGLVGGWLVDKVIGVRMTMFLGILLEGAGLLILPHVTSLPAMMIVGILIGSLAMVSTTAWFTIPGTTRNILSSDVPTAGGLMLSIVAIGGVIMPVVYAWLASSINESVGWSTLGVITILTGLLVFLDKAHLRQS